MTGHAAIFADWFGLDETAAALLAKLYETHIEHGWMVSYEDIRQLTGPNPVSAKRRLRELDAAMEPGSISLHPWRGAKLTPVGVKECVVALRQPEYKDIR